MLSVVKYKLGQELMWSGTSGSVWMLWVGITSHLIPDCSQSWTWVCRGLWDITKDKILEMLSLIYSLNVLFGKVVKSIWLSMLSLRCVSTSLYCTSLLKDSNHSVKVCKTLGYAQCPSVKSVKIIRKNIERGLKQRRCLHWITHLGESGTNEAMRGYGSVQKFGEVLYSWKAKPKLSVCIQRQTVKSPSTHPSRA